MVKYILLGIVQGMTEFLPVSSSGHLVILQKVLGLSGQELAVSVVLHLGTLCALVLFFFRDILGLLHNLKWLILIAVVTLITGVIGFIGKDFFEGLFTSPKAVALSLLVTAAVLIKSRRFMDARRNILDITDALILGVAQGAAVIPGLSRSGVTISSLLFRKIDRELAFKFSFLAAVPAILGATILEAKKIDLAFKAAPLGLGAGFACSFIFGMISLWLLKAALKKAKFHYFGYYCLIVALVTLIFIK